MEIMTNNLVRNIQTIWCYYKNNIRKSTYFMVYYEILTHNYTALLINYVIYGRILCLPKISNVVRKSNKKSCMKNSQFKILYSQIGKWQLLNRVGDENLDIP